MTGTTACSHSSSLLIAGLACLTLMIAPEALSDDSITETRPLRIVASNYPLAFFARRIAGDAADVESIDCDDSDPAHWRPQRADVLALQRADMILLVGAGYEPWTEWTTLYRRRLVDTSLGYTDRLLASEQLPTHNHGPEGDHSHRATAFTTWLDLRLAIEQVGAVERALANALPERAERMRSNGRALVSELEALDARLESVASIDASRPLLASHPVYGYLQRRYGVNLRSVHWEPDETPPSEEWENLAELLSAHPARHMIWEAEPLDGVRERLLAMGVASVVFDPMAAAPDEGDFLAGMERNARALEQVYRLRPVEP